MTIIELKVNREQIKNFLKNGFKDYILEGEKGILNYPSHITLASYSCEKILSKADRRIRSYLSEIVFLAMGFEESISNLLFCIDEFNILGHQGEIEKLVAVYNDGEEIAHFSRDISAREIRKLLLGQITTTNMIFDSERRNQRDFKENFFGDPVEFIEYIRNLEDKL